MEEYSEQYKSRCIRRLKEWGAPLEGWYCVRMYDVADDDSSPDDVVLATCELCGCPSVRYVHVMRHVQYFEDVEVGCICAGIMEGDILSAKARDNNMKYRGKIKNDNMENEAFYDFLLAAFTNTEAAMAQDASIYVFHADTEGLNFRKAFSDAGFQLSGCCIWKKPSLVLGRSPYQWQHEPVLFGWKKKGKHNWYTDRKQTTIWEFEKPKKNADHPTMKPIALIAYPIMNSSLTNCIVLDPFGGSGSTLIACEQSDRICFTIELDEKYCDVIVKRYIEQVSGADGVTVIRDGVTMKYAEVTSDAMTTGGFTLVEEEKSPTLLSRDYKDAPIVSQPSYGIDRAAFNQGQNALYKPAIEEEQQPTLTAKGPGAVAQPASFSPHPDYIVRRLTPTECARLQGFPDYWCSDLGIENPTEDDIAFWTEVWETHRKINGVSKKPKSQKQIIKWLNNPHSDAAEYKMWGNGVALPCVCFVLSGIVLPTQDTPNNR